MPVEVELKLSADGPAPLEQLAGIPRLGPAILGIAQRTDEIDRYLDTADGLLAAARWACRLRTRGAVTIVSLKGPPEPGGGGALHRRPEVEGPAVDVRDPAAWPPSVARDFLDELRGEAPLVERLALVQDRTERAVSVGGEAIGTLSLDRVEVRRRAERLGQMWIVELELSPGAPERDLDALRLALERVEGLRPDPTTKLERGLALAAGVTAPSGTGS